MITNETGFRQALDQLAQAYRSLAAVREQYQEADRQWRGLLLGGHIDHIRQLQQEIEQYAGVAVFEGPQEEPDVPEKGVRVENGTGPTGILTDLLAALHSSPFRPFRLHLTDGTHLDVRRPDLALPTRRSVVVGVDGSEQVPDRTVTIALAHIVRVEPLDVSAA